MTSAASEHAAHESKTEIMRLLESRSSVRKFHPETVSEELLLTILRSACRAPTSSNVQAYSMVVVRDQVTRGKLAQFAGNQAHVADTPVFLAVCADLSRMERACQLHGKTFAGNTLEMGMVATIDAALVGMSIMLVAESLGLGCVFIGGIRNHPVEAAQLLHLPARAFVAFGMCLGWPAERPPQKPRMPAEAVIHFEAYDAERTDRMLAEYDRQLHESYAAHGFREPQSWTARIASEFSRPRRADLRDKLVRLGVPFS